MSITLEAGKRYVMQNGQVTGVMQEYTEVDLVHPDDRFYTDEWIDDFAPMWRVDGKSTFFDVDGDEDKEYYIVEEAK